jgi:uncharacterized protein YjbJ (UPF0337 family)
MGDCAAESMILTSEGLAMKNTTNTPNVPSPTKQKWEGRWEQLAGKAKKIWGNLTDDDLMKVKGDYEQLIGQIKERTGKSREEIEKALES